MGNPVEGVVSAGASSSAVAPIIVGGLDQNGIARPLRVDVDGIVETLETPGSLDDLSNVTGADAAAKGSVFVATTIGNWEPVQVATIQTGAPSNVYITPLVYDDTAVTGGLYAWTGTQYDQIGGLIA